MAKYFGTDGIRGRFGDPTMCPKFAYKLGSALGKYLASTRPGKAHSVVIGRDTRSSGVALGDALIAGLNSSAVRVFQAGVVPTPAVARSVLEVKCDLGIAVTASHNPSSDNGIKLFDYAACKLSEEQELLIEELIDREQIVYEGYSEPQFTPFDAASFYIGNLKSMLVPDGLAGWDVVLDLANGATVDTTPSVFRHSGATLHLLGDLPNGENINEGVGSECPGQLAAAVIERRAKIGIAHDGDGDRLVVCDELGYIVEGDVVLALLGRYAIRKGELSSGVLVATVHSNLGLDRAIEQVGGYVERVDVGDRNVAQRMRDLGASVGGESSGHIIFSDVSTTGDGLLAAIKIIELMRQTGKALSELRQEVVLFPQQTVNLRVEQKRPLDQLPSLKLAIKIAEADFAKQGRVLVRYSGTEPKLRILVEGRDPTLVASVLNKVESAARVDLDVIDS